MRSVVLASLVAFAFGCGRSDLVDNLYLDFDHLGPLDASVGPDDALAPPEDGSAKPPPARDAGSPRRDAAMVPEDAMATEDAPFEPDDASEPPPVLCDPKSCSTGCCYGNICALGTQDIACGYGGGACKACPSGSACVGAGCVPMLR
jgi:hypothetical protein